MSIVSHSLHVKTITMLCFYKHFINHIHLGIQHQKFEDLIYSLTPPKLGNRIVLSMSMIADDDQTFGYTTLLSFTMKYVTALHFPKNDMLVHESELCYHCKIMISNGTT